MPRVLSATFFFKALYLTGIAIKADVLGLDVVAGSVDGYEKEWNINGETVLLGVKKGE